MSHDSTMSTPRPLRILAASGMLGYGYTAEAFEHGVAMGLDLICCDAGSMDPGPYYLGEGTPWVSRTATRTRPASGSVTVTVTVPASVNFSPLPTRLVSTCRNPCRQPT